MNIFKQVLGVDVAQKELVVTLGRAAGEDRTLEFYSRRKFSNKETGFAALLKWLRKNTSDAASLRVVMEATGVYHQKFAYFLNDNNVDISIVLPNKISNYMRTLDVKTVTDETCADAIARFGLERNLEDWKRPEKIYRTLQQLTRERDQIVSERSVIKNQIHAEEAGADPSRASVERMQERIRLMNRQEKEIKKEIAESLKKDKKAQQTVDRLCTIPGIGTLTAVIILAETNCFELIRNKKQLVSYAGLDVKEKQSGTSVKGKPRISKRGNRHLRKSLHLPSLSAVKKIEAYKELYARLVSKSGIKMKGLVAVQRKLLELTYILYRNETVFDSEYEKKKRDALQADTSLRN